MYAEGIPFVHYFCLSRYVIHIFCASSGSAERDKGFGCVFPSTINNKMAHDGLRVQWYLQCRQSCLRFLCKRLCPRKWLMLFSSKFQRDNQKNASAMDSAKGKTGEKGCLFTVLWRWNNHTLWQSHSKRMANKLLSHAIRQQKTHKNVISIYYKKTRTIEHGWRFFPWLCHRKRLMLSFLKL